MTRRVLLATVILLTTVLATGWGAEAKLRKKPKPPKEVFPETTDPVEARKDADFFVQGEYRGKGSLSGQAAVKIGAQVIALSKGEFEVVVYHGGLPGEGWKRGDARFHMTGLLKNGVVNLTSAKEDSKLEGMIAAGKLTLTEKKGPVCATLTHITRESPTLGAVPPQGAMILFNGPDQNRFPGSTIVSDEKNLLSDATSVPLPADYHLHLEFRLSYMPLARGQARSNSGVYLHDCYEVQVLDSFGLEGENNECGGFYKFHAPIVNMCFPPLTWQTYDIDFTAPRYDGDQKTSNARVTVVHNGVLIQDNVELPANTPGRKKEGPAPRPLYLQGHGNHVQYRNIWIVEKK